MLNPFKLFNTMGTFLQNENTKYIGKYYCYEPCAEGYMTLFKVVSNIAESPDRVTVLGFTFATKYSYKNSKQFHKITCNGKIDAFEFEVKNFPVCKEIPEEVFMEKLNMHLELLLDAKPYNRPPY